MPRLETRPAELEAEIVAAVCSLVRERLPDEQAGRRQSFVRQYYHRAPVDDLATRDPLDLYGATMAQWALAHCRLPGHTKVRVYNPDFEQHGWRSSHTVLEIVSDQMPFLVDSVTMELNRQGYSIDLMIHPLMRVQRDERGALVDIVESRTPTDDTIGEWFLHAEVVRETDRTRLGRLREGVERVLEDVRRAVEDWQPMRMKVADLVDELARQPPPVDAEELAEAKAFLAWIADDHFTFLGYREYELLSGEGGAGIRAVPESGLGVLRGSPARPYTKVRHKALDVARARHVLVLTKANSRATVHRPAYLDYIGVKRFGSDGEVVGERRFLGLYTTAAYKESARQIPGVRVKVQSVLDRAGFSVDSHEAKALVEILESYPRDSLFQVRLDDLFTLAMGLLTLGERQRVRLFVCPDRLDRFVECLVTIPRDRYHTENRERVCGILVDAFRGVLLDWTAQLSDSVLARVYFRVRCPDGIPDDYALPEIEAQLVMATRAWRDDLREALIEEHGEAKGSRLYRRYEDAFPAGYRSDWTAQSAVADIDRIEQLVSGGEPILNLYRPVEAPREIIRCKFFSATGVLLSDVLPTFEHMGAKVVDERPYEIAQRDRKPAWVYDFGLQVAANDLALVRDKFEDTFLGVWRGELEDDGLNGLVLAAGLTGREIAVIRAVGKYLRQGGIPFSDAYMERTLLGHPDVAILLVRLLGARFDPDHRDSEAAERLETEIEQAIDAIASLDEDRILRSFLSVVRAMLRTNFFCAKAAGARAYVSFKLDPALIPILPLPRPRFEIFVYSPRVEGVHLRGGKVARGGLRWSDRREDFRTEILGLMKAQMGKNALIVPVGSKGGFVLKRPPAGAGREALQREAIDCYKMFLRGLLDITDNIADGDVVGPDRVVRYDEDDPYLVVAADKGTATFSDIANEVSARYGFWLGDAFASGGSQGYDHKQMGITARGAWESVKRHFRELGLDSQSTDFTVVGIGDMSGDVFGNGMLLSPHIKLVAAFNHAHVFLDPNPDREASFEERKRLFELPRSSWSDYDESAISEGGGVYARGAKSIPISPQVREALAIEATRLSPHELVMAILKAPVDLLWNGGIGTYVKASDELHADVGDKANDAVRVDGRELRCRIVGEGGNLGFTQRGRIEYALAGGRVNTDAVDNVAGVNCSDHEVNIKILLDSVAAAGVQTVHERNALLAQMTDAVAEQVRYASYTQTQALSLALAQAAPMVDVHARLISHLEQVAGLDRAIEFLPTEEEINRRKVDKLGLVAPELSVLMAHCKIHLYTSLLESDLPEDEYLQYDLERYFPPPLSQLYVRQTRAHRLRREIIATVVANQLVDRAGTTFVFRLGDETGAPPPLIARAYAAARDIFESLSFWDAVEALDNQVDAQTQVRMLIEGRRLVERGARWMLRANAQRIDIAGAIARFRPGVRLLTNAIPHVFDADDRELYDRRTAELVDAGVPWELSTRVAVMPTLPSVFDTVEIANQTSRSLETVINTYFRLASRLKLNWLRDRIIALPRTNLWQALAREALRDELYSTHRALTQGALDMTRADSDRHDALTDWEHRHCAALEQWLVMLDRIKASGSYDMTTLPVALRAVRNLIRG